jgi:PAS domain S-box-containing protein
MYHLWIVQYKQSNFYHWPCDTLTCAERGERFCSESEKQNLKTSSIDQHFLLSDLIVQQAPIGISYLSLEGHFLQVNEQFCAIVGYTQEELLKMTLWDLAYTSEHKIIDASLHRSLVEDAIPHTVERGGMRKDRKPFWIKVTTSALRSPTGKVLGFLSVAEDITQRKQAEAESERLLNTERQAREEALVAVMRFKAIFESMRDAVLVHDLAKGVLYINRAALQLFELQSEDECIGKTTQEIFQSCEIYDGQWRPVPNGSRPVCRIVRGEVLSGEPTEDLIIRMPSGREHYLSVSGAPVQDRYGGVAGGVCVFRDVTEQRQRERRIQRTLDSLLTVVEALAIVPEYLDSLPGTNSISSLALTAIGQKLSEAISQVIEHQTVGIISLEPPGNKLHFVGAIGFSPADEARFHEEIEQSTLVDYLDADAIARLHNDEVVLRDLTHESFMTPRSTFGTEHLLIAPMLASKQLIGVFSLGKAADTAPYTAQEIALAKAIARMTAQVLERVRLLKEWAEAHANELALQEANRRFDSFLSIASHELRTPLTTIKGSTQLALRRLEKLERQAAAHGLTELAERVRQPLVSSVMRTRVQERMIGDLLDASRIRANRLELSIQPCNLVEIVHTAVEDLQQSYPDRSILLHLPAEGTLPLLADADRIGQVTNNFITNALKYSPAEQPVEVRLAREGEMARLSVRDQGPGLPPEEHARIWERFYRVKGIENQSGFSTGLGLGLYICRMIIELHRGSVGLDSAPGHGSTFWFTLPLH